MSRRAAGDGSVKRLSNGRWKATGTVPGSWPQQRRVVYADTKRGALDKLRGTIPLHLSTNGGVSQQTVAEWLAQWLDSRRLQVTPGTVEYYARRINRYLIPAIGGYRLANLTPSDIADSVAGWTAAGAPVGEIRNSLTTLRAALRTAVDLGLVPTNAAKSVPKPRTWRRNINPLTVEHVRAFLDAARGERLYALWVLALDSAMRPGELLALRWADVDWKANTIHVQRSLENVCGRLRIKETKTRAGKRVLKLPARTFNTLRELSKENEYVFLSTAGTLLDWTNVRHSFKRICRRAGLPDHRPYDLRHTTATLLLTGGVDVKTVSEFLGHEDITTTLRHYSHVLESGRSRISEVVGGLFGGVNVP